MLLFVTVEAAVQNLTLMPLNSSEVLVTWDVDPDLFELSFFNVAYFVKSELQKAANITDRSYQLSDLIPGEAYSYILFVSLHIIVKQLIVEYPQHYPLKELLLLIKLVCCFNAIHN